MLAYRLSYDRSLRRPCHESYYINKSLFYNSSEALFTSPALRVTGGGEEINYFVAK